MKVMRLQTVFQIVGIARRKKIECSVLSFFTARTKTVDLSIQEHIDVSEDPPLELGSPCHHAIFVAISMFLPKVGSEIQTFPFQASQMTPSCLFGALQMAQK